MKLIQACLRIFYGTSKNGRCLLLLEKNPRPRNPETLQDPNFGCLPEPSGRSGSWVKCTAKGPPCRGSGRQIGGQGRDGLGIVAGVVGELDRNRLRGTLRDGSVQLANGALGLDPLIEPDETDSLGET